MNKIIVLLFILATCIFAQAQQPFNEQCNVHGIPPGSCVVQGFVCNAGFNVGGEKSMLFFKIGADAACTSTALFKSQISVYENPADSTSEPINTTIFLVEDEYETGPLSLTLAGSIAMSASLNERMVSVVYKKVKDEAYGGIRLLTIEFYNP